MVAPRKIELLQAGRGMAAILVVAYHANHISPVTGLFEYGRYGVDFFFVLSGYIIYHLVGRGSFDLGSFAYRRLTRIFLPYWPVGIFAALAYLWLGRSVDWPASLFLTPGTPALSVAWTLQRELLFYAIIAVGFSIGRPFLCVGIWSAAVAANVLFPPQLPGPISAVVLDPHNLEFAAGMVGARLFTLPHVRLGRTLNLLGDASYSIYLCHLPAMGALWRLGFGFPALVLGGIASGIAYHLCCERPMLRWSRRQDQARLGMSRHVPGVPAAVHIQPIGPPADGVSFQTISPRA